MKKCKDLIHLRKNVNNLYFTREIQLENGKIDK